MTLEKEFNATKSPQAAEPLIANQADFISIKDNKVIYRIAYSEINYIQSWGNYLKFHLVDGNIKIVRKTIKNVESELASNQFIRIHKSYIVNIFRVKSIEGNQIKLDNLHLPIGKSYSINVRKTITGKLVSLS